MNRKQFSEHIGNMDDRLVEQAATLPNYAAQYRKKRIQQIMAAAAVLVLMLCSFSVGALAFAREIIVEVPVEAEKVELKEIGITLLFPYSWKGKYEVVESTAENGSKLWEFCVKSIYDAKTPVDESGEDVYHGTLFSVFQYADHSVSADEFAYDAGIAGFSSYLCSTGKATYAIRYAEERSLTRKMLPKRKNIIP